jgi:hypothetical protein
VADAVTLAELAPADCTADSSRLTAILLEGLAALSVRFLVACGASMKQALLAHPLCRVTFTGTLLGAQLFRFTFRGGASQLQHEFTLVSADYLARAVSLPSVYNAVMICWRELQGAQRVRHLGVSHAPASLRSPASVGRPSAEFHPGSFRLSRRRFATPADWVGVIVSSSRHNVVLSDGQITGNTPFWMAPEVIQQADYNEKADIWSIGITVIEMIRGEPPLHDLHPVKALFIIPKSEPPSLESHPTATRALKDFVALCCQKEPERRPSVRELLKHKFIKSAKKNAMLLDFLAAVRNKKLARNFSAGVDPFEEEEDAGQPTQTRAAAAADAETAGKIEQSAAQGDDRMRADSGREADEETADDGWSFTIKSPTTAPAASAPAAGNLSASVPLPQPQPQPVIANRPMLSASVSVVAAPTLPSPVAGLLHSASADATVVARHTSPHHPSDAISQNSSSPNADYSKAILRSRSRSHSGADHPSTTAAGSRPTVLDTNGMDDGDLLQPRSAGAVGEADDEAELSSMSDGEMDGTVRRHHGARSPDLSAALHSTPSLPEVRRDSSGSHNERLLGADSPSPQFLTRGGSRLTDDEGEDDERPAPQTAAGRAARASIVANTLAQAALSTAALHLTRRQQSSLSGADESDDSSHAGFAAADDSVATVRKRTRGAAAAAATAQGAASAVLSPPSQLKSSDDESDDPHSEYADTSHRAASAVQRTPLILSLSVAFFLSVAVLSCRQSVWRRARVRPLSLSLFIFTSVYHSFVPLLFCSFACSALRAARATGS